MIAKNEHPSPMEIFIRPAKPWPRIHWREVFVFSDLLWLMVRRDIVARYRRTYLGFLWYLITPLFLANLFSVVFARFLSLPTGKTPAYLFYLCVLPIWNYFTRALEGTASSLTSNAALSSKVYFPRLIFPLATIISPLFVFAIQFSFFLLLLTIQNASHPTRWIFFIPALIGLTALLSLGLGLWCAALTVRYRDIQHALGFFIQVAFYVTPILYPISYMGEKWAALLRLNPMWVVVEGFRMAFLGVGHFTLGSYFQALGIVFVFAASGLFLFNRVQQDFVDRL